MSILARPPDQAYQPLSALPPSPLVPGTAVHVAYGEVALFVRGGVVAGWLGEGEHALDPNALPWLWKLSDAYGNLAAELVFAWLAVFEQAAPGRAVSEALPAAFSEALHAGWQPAQICADPVRLIQRVAELAPFAAPPPAAPAVPAPSAEPVYEMLWDCRHCSSTKLLGLTHRHCPNCGAPQNPSERYFPSDDEKIAVQNHVYYGADRLCRYCQNPNSRNSKHCGTCGGPLEEGTDVQRRGDQVHALAGYAGETAADARREFSGAARPAAVAPKKKTPWGKIALVALGAMVLALLGLFVVAVVWTKPAGLEVTGHQWKREIEIERFGPVEGTAWCDSLPSGAVVKGRSRAVRSHERVKKGEKCQTRKVDLGDGTFRESRECQPVYDEKPIYADECRYTVDRWSKARTLERTGSARTPAPEWPALTLARTGQCLGCEREGQRRESYVVTFVSSETRDTSTCTFDQQKWQSFEPGSRWQGEVGVLVGNLDCGSLTKR